ncbi:MAG: hypothetical protein REI64_11580 [Pedobacter sp.]|uniref:hypothetical protein n=1 Tax=Pedobacter sp. TaxID=1411316 RepID=UPI0028082A5D|nr:hypothetical protein [Pedobacter sp.]MDQ8005431.1 hypothetical protein [Pedobacter sp.]
MKQFSIFFLLLLLNLVSYGQELKLKKRSNNALTGSEFAKFISDTTLSLVDREELIFKEVRKGNIPIFLQRLSSIRIEKVIDGTDYKLTLFVLPDYLAIGDDEDYFYVPTTPMLAQRIANATRTMLPTKLMVDEIYKQAKIKFEPQPIPPTKAMTTVPVFIVHNNIVLQQLKDFKVQHLQSYLTAGNKKDIIISNKIYGQPTARVVIYGWHKLDGKAIQPVYNKHTNTWADYSHGVRLVSETAILNGKKVKLANLLKHPLLHQLVSDEGVILNSKYPIN